MAQLDILYFAWVREAIGKDSETIVHPGAGTTIAMLVAQMSGQGSGYAEAFARPDKLRAALDQNFVPLDTALDGARELALFPPVTGG